MATMPLPVPTEWSAPFWDGVNEGKLRYQFCAEAQEAVMYPKRLSPYTLRDTLEWCESAGRGVIYTFTIQRVGAPSGFADELPYVIAVIKLDEGFQMLSNVVGVDVDANADAIHCGARVRVVFREIDGSTLPMFELEEEGA